MARATKLPRGIRLRGNKYFVDVSVKGRGRKTATVDTLEEALIRQITLRKELSGEADAYQPLTEPQQNSKENVSWTLKAVAERVLATPAPEGWRGSSSETKMGQNVKDFCNYFGGSSSIYAVNEDRIDGYVEFLANQGNSNATINRKLSALSKVLAFAERKSRRAYLKPQFPKRLREGRGRIRQLSPEEEQALLRAFITLGDMDGHDYTMVLIDTGMRVGELLAVDYEDVDIDGPNPMILVHGKDAQGTKNGEFRSVPMTSRVLEVMKRRRFSSPDRPFNVKDVHWYSRRWDKARDLLGFSEDPQFIPHMLRHTCASRLVQRGVSLRIVQEWLGHKSLQMTMRYSHLYPKDLFAARDALEGTKDRDKVDT